MDRALRFDGVLPQVKTDAGEFPAVSATVVSEVATLAAASGSAQIDIIVEGSTGDDAGIARCRSLAEAGATWWIEGMWGSEESSVRARLAGGPPAQD